MISLETDAKIEFRNHWIQILPKMNYRNEIEVEVKFIQPLLDYLGYKPNEYCLRYPVTIQVGRQQNKGSADWVVGRKNSNEFVVNFVIEAKEPNQQLDEYVKGQARSYTFALNAPIYVLTNGQKIQVYQRGVQVDECVFDCDVENLSDQWENLEKIIGVSAIKRTL
ncbi:MAG: type I restriction enzyme HsdR N-terminal domain-containing protein [Chloroflexota bacterium]